MPIHRSWQQRPQPLKRFMWMGDLDSIHAWVKLSGMATKKAKRANATKARVSGRRRTNEQKQEKKSRYQLALSWEDWPLQSNAEDLGEDLFFQIYAEGNYTGLSFQVQLKSTSDLSSLIQKKFPNDITYRFETKDLLHWENSVPSVVLVVWDVKKQLGHWLDVPAAIKALDSSGKPWRAKKTVAVRLPRTHTTDEAGCAAIRATIAHLAYPMLADGRQITVTPTFTFPPTDAGRALAEELRKTIEEGGTITIDGQYIEEFRMSPWWERAYGVRIPQFLTITAGPGHASLTLQLQAIGAERTESLSVELTRTKGGVKQTTFETVSKTGPVDLMMIMSEGGLNMALSFRHPCKTAYDSLALTRFLIALEQGAILQVALANGMVIGKQNKFEAKGGRALAQLLLWESLLKKLNYIQTRVARFGSFSIEHLSEEDIPTIERLWTILRTGEYRAVMSFSMKVKTKPNLPSDGTGALSFQVNPFGEETLLGVSIPLGEVHCEFLDSVAAMRPFLLADYSSPTQIEMKDLSVLRRYVDWMGSKDGPEKVPEVIETGGSDE